MQTAEQTYAFHKCREKPFIITLKRHDIMEVLAQVKGYDPKLRSPCVIEITFEFKRVLKQDGNWILDQDCNTNKHKTRSILKAADVWRAILDTNILTQNDIAVIMKDIKNEHALHSSCTNSSDIC